MANFNEEDEKMPDLREKKQKRFALVTEARVLLDKAEGEKRDLTADEEQQYDRIMADVDKIGGEIQQVERSQERRARVTALEAEGQQSEGRAVPPVVPGQSQEQTTEARVNPRGTEEYRAAFNHYLRAGLRAVTPEEYRALQADSDAAGGFVVSSQQFSTGLIKAVDDMVYIRQLATVIRVDKAESLGVPALDSDPDDAEWTAEIKTGSEDSAMDFAKRELRPHPLAKRIKVSNKLIRIASVNIESLVQSRLAYKFGVTQEKAFLVGVGANCPLGVFIASDSGIPTSRDVSTGNTATEIKGDGLINAKYTLKPQYRTKARWMFHRDGIKMIRKLKDGNGDYLWKAGLSDKPDTILEIPFLESEYVPNTFTTGLYGGILGDFSFYWIADALDMQIQVLDQLYAETNQVGFIGRWESDGMPTLSEAFVRVKLA